MASRSAKAVCGLGSADSAKLAAFRGTGRREGARQQSMARRRCGFSQESKNAIRTETVAAANNNKQVAVDHSKGAAKDGDDWETRMRCRYQMAPRAGEHGRMGLGSKWGHYLGMADALCNIGCIIPRTHGRRHDGSTPPGSDGAPFLWHIIG